MTANTPSDDESSFSMRIKDLAPHGKSHWFDYALGMAWAIVESGHELSGVDVYIESDVPIGAGLSSSAALECAVGLALRDLFAPELSLPELASLAQRAENAFVGVPSGIMDQTASLCCIAGHALFLDTRSLEFDQVPFNLERVGLRLVVIDTAVRHRLKTSAYADRRNACEEAAREIHVSALRDATLAELELVSDDVTRRRARHVITEDARVLSAAQLLRTDRIDEIGPLLTASHESLRKDFEVTCPELDLTVEVALDIGALGARMIGGGFGGCAIALIEEQGVERLTIAVTDAFSHAGYDTPHFFNAAPADGARRIE
jgi:galactokinase